MRQDFHTRLPRRVLFAALAFAAVLASNGACGTAGRPTAPSPAAPSTPRIIALPLRDGILLKAEHLDGAQQVEGVLEWQPKTLWYQSFDRGQWWFSTNDWEWAIVPSEGRAMWGIWRKVGATGDGVLGMIRFAGEPSIESLEVWVDGHPVDGVLEDRRADGRWSLGALTPGSGLLQGGQGERAEHRWFMNGLDGHR